MKKTVLSLILVTVLIGLMTSCSSPKTSIRVRNNSDGTQTTINVRNGEGSSTSVSVAPTASVDSVSFTVNSNR